MTKPRVTSTAGDLFAVLLEMPLGTPVYCDVDGVRYRITGADRISKNQVNPASSIELCCERCAEGQYPLPQNDTP